MSETSWIIINALIAVIAVLASIVAIYHNKTKDIKAEAQEKGSILTEISNLKATVEKSNEALTDRILSIETRAEIRARDCSNHGEKLVRVEQDIKAAHRRLDEHVALFADIRKAFDEIIRQHN